MLLTNSSGQIVSSYTYGTYGELLSGDTSLTRYLYNGRFGVATDANGLYYMRHRYYNSEIKRFINQDILTGSIDNSQSLNRYSYVQGNPVSYIDPFGLSPSTASVLAGVSHVLLGVLGAIPGKVGIASNLLDALVYAVVDKDPAMTVFSLICASGMTASKLIKESTSVRVSKTANYVRVSCDVVSNGVNFAKNSGQAIDTGIGMYQKYAKNGESFGAETLFELGALSLSVFGAAMSGRSLLGAGKELSSLLSEDLDPVLQRMKAGYEGFAADNRGYADFGGNKGGSGSVSKYQKASIWERITKRKANVNELQANPLDEFSNPKIGPCESAVSKYIKEINQTGKLSSAIEVQKLANGGYEIVNGHHRWMAALKTGLEKVPIKIKNYTN